MHCALQWWGTTDQCVYQLTVENGKLYPWVSMVQVLMTPGATGGWQGDLPEASSVGSPCTGRSAAQMLSSPTGSSERQRLGV